MVYAQTIEGNTVFKLGYWNSKLSNSVATLAMARESWHKFEKFPIVLIIETVLMIFNNRKLGLSTYI